MSDSFHYNNLRPETRRSAEPSKEDVKLTETSQAPKRWSPGPDIKPASAGFVHPEASPQQSKIETSLPETDEHTYELGPILKALGKSLDNTFRDLRGGVDGIRSELRESMQQISLTMSKELVLQDEIERANHENLQLRMFITSLQSEIEGLKAIKSEYEGLVSADFNPLLESLDAVRRPLVYSMIHFLTAYSAHRFPPQLLVESAHSLGATVHQNPQPSGASIDKCADTLNQLFKRNGESQPITIRRVRTGDAIDPAFMDGPELQGKRTIAEAKNWMVLAGERVIRKAQVIGR